MSEMPPSTTFADKVLNVRVRSLDASTGSRRRRGPDPSFSPRRAKMPKTTLHHAATTTDDREATRRAVYSVDGRHLAVTEKLWNDSVYLTQWSECCADGASASEVCVPVREDALLFLQFVLDNVPPNAETMSRDDIILYSPVLASQINKHMNLVRTLRAWNDADLLGCVVASRILQAFVAAFLDDMDEACRGWKRCCQCSADIPADFCAELKALYGQRV